MIQILYFRIEYVCNDHVIDIKIINIYSVTICSTNIIRYIRLFFFKIITEVSVYKGHDSGSFVDIMSITFPIIDYAFNPPSNLI